MKTVNKSALKIALAYSALTTVWVTAANVGMHMLLPDQRSHVYVEACTDLLQAAPAAIVIYLLLCRELRIRAARNTAEQRLSNVLETATSAIISLDTEGRVLLFNQGAQTIFGYRATEVLGCPVAQLIPDLREITKYFGERDAPRPFAAPGPQMSLVQAKRKNGSEFPAEVTLSEFSQDGRKIRTIILNDISLRREAEKILAQYRGALEARVQERTKELQRDQKKLRQAHSDLESRNRELGSLLQISQEITSTLELGPLLDLILDQLKTALDCPAGSILNYDQGRLKVMACRGAIWQDEVRQSGAAPGNLHSYTGLLQRRLPVVIDRFDAAVETRLGIEEGAVILRSSGSARALMAVPLRTCEGEIGLLVAEHPEPGHFSMRHGQLALVIANQAAIAIQNARLFGESRKIAALEERTRLGRELHDSVCQALYGIALGTHAAKEMVEEKSGQLGDTLDYVKSLAQVAHSEMRALILEMRSELLDRAGLMASVARLAEKAREQHTVDDVFVPEPEPQLSPGAKEAIFRICQEALANATKYAQASKIVIQIRQVNEDISVEISDDGVGFEPDRSCPGHFGLQSMRERAQELGGALLVASQPGRGSRVTAIIPAIPNWESADLEAHSRPPVNSIETLPGLPMKARSGEANSARTDS
jgi:PAS domain S-box-containing protein